MALTVRMLFTSGQLCWTPPMQLGALILTAVCCPALCRLQGATSHAPKAHRRGTAAGHRRMHVQHDTSANLTHVSRFTAMQHRQECAEQHLSRGSCQSVEGILSCAQHCSCSTYHQPQLQRLFNLLSAGCWSPTQQSTPNSVILLQYADPLTVIYSMDMQLTSCNQAYATAQHCAGMHPLTSCAGSFVTMFSCTPCR
jgi:hypothetical protein